MERSNWPKRLSKQGYTPDCSQWNRIRFSSVEQIMEDEDQIEARIRHSYRKQASRSEQGTRTLSGGMGTVSRLQEN